MNNKALLVIGGLLIFLGLTKPDLSWLNINLPRPVVSDIVVTEPTDAVLLAKCNGVIDSLRSGPSARTVDGKKLAELYQDLATLFSLDGENVVVTTTEEIRQANSIAGQISRLGLKDKYPDLASSSEAVVVAALGEENVPLNSTSRAKAVEAFQALSWACYQGSK